MSYVAKFIIMALVALTALPSVIFALPAQVIIIRNGEKQKSGLNLSDNGKMRAGALVDYFMKDLFVSEFGRPIVIFVPKTKSPMHLYELETITPLAKALNVKIDNSFAPREIENLAFEILSNPDYNKKLVLVCWQHSLIDDIAEALKVHKTILPYPENRYDLVFKITYPQDNSAKPNFCVGLQKLLKTDSDKLPSGYQYCL